MQPFHDTSSIKRYLFSCREVTKDIPIFFILEQFDCIYLYLSISFDEKSLRQWQCFIFYVRRCAFTRIRPLVLTDLVIYGLAKKKARDNFFSNTFFLRNGGGRCIILSGYSFISFRIFTTYSLVKKQSWNVIIFLMDIPNSEYPRSKLAFVHYIVFFKSLRQRLYRSGSRIRGDMALSI